MSYVRSAGYRMKDPDDDAALQVVIGDLERLALNLNRGSVNSAYVLNATAAKDLGVSTGVPAAVPCFLRTPARRRARTD